MPVYRLTDAPIFPPAEQADSSGLLAVGGDLSRERLLRAYAAGIFPWYSEGQPVLWWSPDPRLVLYPEDFHCSRRLRRTLRSGRFRITADAAFGKVIRACAYTPREGQDGTWITGDMEAAYIDLHHAGYAHSVECWQDERLVGGLYGVALGGAFFGESMFSHESDASKAALAHLAHHLGAWGYGLIDCQVTTAHLCSLGAHEMPRARFLKEMRVSLQLPGQPAPWSFEPWHP